MPVTSGESESGGGDHPCPRAQFGVEAGNHIAARDVLVTYGLLNELIPLAE
jgi:hypothetical protein